MKKKNTFIRFVFYTLAGTTLCNAQDAPGKPFGAESPIKEGRIPCASTEYEAYLNNKYPKRQSVSDYEQWLADKAAGMRNRGLRNTDAVVTLPVVVHIIHDGDEIGISENIPDERILSQMQVLNDDFRRVPGTRGYDENTPGTDVEIEFCLAQRDPDGNPTTGIVRHNLGRETWNTENVETFMKPETAWDSSKYINIWVCRVGGDLQMEGCYAFFPEGSGLDGLEEGQSTAESDGLVLSFRAFGSSDTFPATTYIPGNDKGRTLTHEMGHFFGLRHIWGDGFSCDATDYCHDTPPALNMNTFCNPADSCTADDQPDMIENYMDYTPDECKSVFTEGQKARMMTALHNAPRRLALLSSNGCTPPGMGTEDNTQGSLKVYPNPAGSILNVDADITGSAGYEIFNALGQSVAAGHVVLGSGAQLNIGSLVNGIYMLRLSHEGSVSTVKFVRE